jgi:hypothetical protein
MASLPSLSHLDLPAEITLAILTSAIELSKYSTKMFRLELRRRGRRAGRTLRPGNETPLWNTLREQVRPYLRNYGQQANLGRVLGLPRQRINAFITSGRQMPDAERTLQLMAWLIAARSGRRPT